MGAVGAVAGSAWLRTRVRTELPTRHSPNPSLKTFFVQQPDCQAKAAGALNLELPPKTSQ